ncbi:MAG: HipA domain-containing protein [Oscillospiraceae bacterium]|nr:HipA domain-containing protein [Oscillospiraceae bacterium]
MECTLMHKNIPVLDLTISEYSGNIEKHGNIHNSAHIPLGTTINSGREKGNIIPRSLNDWWTGRSIPASRDGIREVFETLGIHNTALLLTKCYGLSLSDQYWVCPKNSGLCWENVNFFHNEFSKDVGEILFGSTSEDPEHISLMSPDNTSDGWLRKKWIIANEKRVLMKGGSGVYQQEPFNEVVATAIMRRLGIEHIPYTVTTEKGKPYSLCENFVMPETELVPAWRVCHTLEKDNRDSHLMHLLRCCENLAIPNVSDAMNKMLVLDYIIANQDRHYNNFGFIRNAETLEWLGFAPIFDSGTSLWYNTQRVGIETESKPFRKTHQEQIKLVTDFSWFEHSSLKGLADEIMEIFSSAPEVDQARAKSITRQALERAGQIEQLEKTKIPLAQRMETARAEAEKHNAQREKIPGKQKNEHEI